MRAMPLLFAIACVKAPSTTPAPPTDAPTGATPPEDISEMLEPLVDSYGIPALAAARLEGDQVTELGAVGVRAADGDDPVTVDDRWHLGSDTKAMTASLIGRLVDRGVLGWETTLAEAFPAVDVHPDLADVTLLQLLQHTSGLTGSLPRDHADLWSGLWALGKPDVRRAELVDELLTRPPDHEAGVHVYSNAGYIVVGAAAEQALGTPWEELTRLEVFEPLGMTGCGFGPPALETDAPWGHLHDGSGYVPVSPDDPAADNPKGLGPAGTVHCDLSSWARFAAAHLQAEPGWLTAASWEVLHTPAPGTDYAGGWAIVDGPDGQLLAHDGSNTMFYASAVLAPDAGFATLVVANAATSDAVEAVYAAYGLLSQR